MKQEPVIFAAAVDGVKRAFGPRLTPEHLVQIKALGVDFDNVQAGYPFSTWVRLLDLLVKSLGDASQPPSEQYRQLGRQFMQGFVQTTIGFATLTMGKLMGIRRTMQRMGRNFRTSANYIDAEVSERDGALIIRCLVVPEYISALPPEASQIVIDYRRGVLEETLVLLGAQNWAVDVVERDDARFAADYRITWQQ